MPKIRDLWPSTYISGEEIHNLPEEHLDVTIKKVYRKKIKDPNGKDKFGVLCDVQESEKPVVLCLTAGRTIQSLHGDESAEWVGKRIRLVPVWGNFFGKDQWAVRVATMVPPIKGAAGAAQVSSPVRSRLS